MGTLEQRSAGAHHSPARIRQQQIHRESLLSSRGSRYDWGRDAGTRGFRAGATARMGGYRRRSVPRFDHVRIAFHRDVTHTPGALAAHRGEHGARTDPLSHHRAWDPAAGLAHRDHDLSFWSLYQAHRDAAVVGRALPAPPSIMKG